MNTYILVLNGNNKDLAIAEFITLYKTFYNEEINLTLLSHTIYSCKTKYEIENHKEFIKRLTYTNTIAKQIFDANDIEHYKQNIDKFNIEQYQGKTFLVRNRKPQKAVKTTYTERELAKPIWDKLTNPKISVENAQVTFNFFFLDNSTKFIFTEMLYENDKDYLLRMPLKRPIKMPYTLKSDMARCAINLLNIKEGTILDPFCGIGGILLEAYDMGFQIIGNDISYNDLKYFKTNFDYFYPDSQYIRTLADSQSQFLKSNTIDGIVTDIPYGRCSRKLGKDLYDQFLLHAKQMLKPNGRIVIIYANFTEFKKIALKYFTEIEEITEYINRSMTRHILVLENRK